MSFSKYSIEKKQVSLDMGVTWQDATPSETRNGRLLGTYMTLVECENADCDLNKLGIQLVDEKIPSVICTHVNSTSGDSKLYDTYLPSGIAKSVTFVSGMKYCGDTWGSSDNIITDEYNNSSITAKTATITTDSNPIREYNSYVLDGREMISGSFCGEATCYNITEFMPWIDTNGTVKMAYTVRYVRKHCSDEWKIDEEYTPQLITFGERWVKVYEDIYKTTWQHQIATDVVSDDSQLGWHVVWENEGEAFDYEYEVTVPQDVQLIEYLRADGLAASAIESNDFYQMKVKIDPRNLGTPSGYLANKWPYSESDPICFWHLYKKATSYYVEAIEGRSTESITELTPNVWRWVNIDMDARAEDMGLFCQISFRNLDPYPVTNDYTLKNTYVGGLKQIDGIMYYPYKIYSNNGCEDEYLNGLEYGFIDRNGNKIPLEYVYGKYTNTDGVTQSLKVNASKKLGARSDVVDVVFSNHVTSLPEGICSGCTSLTSVDIPSSVTVIGEAAFRGCTSLTSVDIPSIVTVIGESAFRECTLLTSVDIPSSVTEIGDFAFVDCMIDTFNMYSIHPPHVGIGVLTRGIITIPLEADLEEWKTAEGWPRYANKIIKRGSVSKGEPYIYRNPSHKGFISDLGVTLKDNTKIEVKLRPTSNGGGMIIGEVNPPNDNDDYRFFWYNKSPYYDYGSDRMHSTLSIHTDYVFEVGNYYIKDLTSGNYILQGNAKSGVATAHTRTLGLFGEVNNDYAWIYYIKIYEGDTLVKDFIPFKLEDGSGTLYDTISKTPCSVSNGTFGIYTE